MDSESAKGDDYPDEPLGRQSVTDEDHFVEMLGAHLQSDFPNPDRENCPSSGVLLNFAGLAKLPDELSNHIFQCSACFAEYRTALSHRGQKAKAAKTSWLGEIGVALRRDLLMP